MVVVAAAVVGGERAGQWGSFDTKKERAEEGQVTVPLFSTWLPKLKPLLVDPASNLNRLQAVSHGQ